MSSRLVGLSRAIVIALCLSCALGSQEVSPCARCHRAESESFSQSPMGNSIGPPVALPGGRITHELSGSVITIEQRDQQIEQIRQSVKAAY